MSKKVFLSARWNNLVIASYKMPDEVLLPYLPKGLELDKLDGSVFASLVAFDFLDTKVKGVKFPFHINFPEINLRFYVKAGEKRGVVFIREFVPKRMISVFANAVYNENYRTANLKSKIEFSDKIKLEHNLNYKGKNYFIKVLAENKPFMPAVDSTEHFFKEHGWGYVANRKGETNVYRVEHPFWEVYPIIKFEHTFDLGNIYGKQFGFMNDIEPYNIAFAKGSEIKVFGGEKL